MPNSSQAKESQPAKSGYAPGHPWYYKLGGRPLYPGEIRDHAVTSNYRDYDADTIAAMDNLAEPKRSEKLRGLRSTTSVDIFWAYRSLDATSD
jgi:hypothetical protein